MATCFDSIESSSGFPKNRSNVSKFYSAFWDPKRLQYVAQLIEQCMCQKTEYIYIYNGIYLKSKMIKVIHENSCVVI